MVLGHPPSSGGLRHTDVRAPSDLPWAGLRRGRIDTLGNSLVGQSEHSGSSGGGGDHLKRQASRRTFQVERAA